MEDPRGNEKLLTRAIRHLEDHRHDMDRADLAAIRQLNELRLCCLAESIQKLDAWDSEQGRPDPTR